METLRNRFLIFLMLMWVPFSIPFSIIANAEDLVPDSAAPSQTPAEPVVPDAKSVPNAVLVQRAEALSKKSMKVVKEVEGVVYLTMPPDGKSFAAHTQIVFFRRKRARMEVVATGLVTGEQKNGAKTEILVEIDKDTIIKYPQSGDFAVPMADPNATAEGDKKDQYDFFVPEEKKKPYDNDRPGYLEYGMGLMEGTLHSNPSDQADDDLVTSGYRFKDTHLAYFSDFFPVGVEIDSHSGNFPTGLYNHTITTSSEAISNLSFEYRFAPFFNRHVAPILIVSTLSDNFTTNNTDDNIISTKITGLGFGPRINFDVVSPMWKPAKAKVGVAFQQLFGEYLYYPNITAVDGTVISRGLTSSGSTGTQYRVGFTSMAYFDFIPIFKRFVLQASYGARQYKLKFQGQTMSEAGTTAIPQNGTTTSGESDVRFFIGLRIEDPIRMLIPPDDGKDEKKK